MNFDLSDEQKVLATQIRRLLAEQAPPARLRALLAAGRSFDAGLWQACAALGFLGADVAEDHGGLGLGALDLCVIVEELGRANAALPVVSSLGFGAEAIRLAGTPAQKERWLPKLASGSAIASFAYADGADEALDLPQCHFEDGCISGTKWPVSDLALADIAIVLCRHGDTSALALVPLEGLGVERIPLESFDPLRGQGELKLEKARAELLDAAGADETCAHLFDRVAVLTAFEQIGGAEACLHMARDYVLARPMFGRPLGSYQAVKHKLADIFVAIELARSNAYFAAWALVHDAPERAQGAAAARLSALEAFEMAARENLQLHGGIGYTLETDGHFYYRRERLLTAALGGRDIWSDRLIAALEP